MYLYKWINYRINHQRKIDNTSSNTSKKYNRDYYHAHKKASDCEHCKKSYSSVSALRRLATREGYQREVPEYATREVDDP